MSDLISRKDAIKHIKAYRDEFKEDFGIDSEDGDDASHHFGYIAGLNRATRIIGDLPTAKPPLETCWGCNCPKMEEPKKGRWIFARYYVWECSECGKNPTRGMGYVQRRSELFRYCPHCGATTVVDDE